MANIASTTALGAPTVHGQKLLADAMHRKGLSFLGATVLLKRQAGGDPYVVLHLLCQGAECFLKGLLLFANFKLYKGKIKRYGKTGHDLALLVDDVLAEFKLNPLRKPVRTELDQLNAFYKTNGLRYGSTLDILIDARTIDSNRVLRRLVAGVRLAKREIKKSRGPDG